MIGYRTRLDKSGQLILQSINEGYPVIIPTWKSVGGKRSAIYCVLMLTDGQCVVTTEKWRTDAVLFVGFIITDVDGKIIEHVAR